MKRSTILAGVLAIAAACGSAIAGPPLVSAAAAEELPRTDLRVVGAWGTLSQFRNYERPFWVEEIARESNGQVTAQITPFNEMGLRGAEIFRLMRIGVIDFGSTVLGYVSGDDARNEAIDLAGLAPDITTARAVSEAFKPVLDDFYREQFGIKVLGVWPYPAQVFYCNGEITGLESLRGKRVRTAGRSIAEFVEALGGVGITMAFSEVVPALQNGVIDCAITGTLSGNAAKWHEVSTHIYELPIGWSQVMHAVNIARWESLDPSVRDFLQTKIGELEARIWEAVEEETQQGFDCNTGKDTCTMGTKANMTLVPVSEGDRQILSEVLVNSVIPQWASRCEGDCLERWNATVGAVVGLTASK